MLRLNPRAAAAQVRLAMIELQRNDLPSATQLAEQAVAAQPGNLTAQLVLARTLLARGDLDRATTVTRGLLEAAPQAAGVQSQAGMLALAKGDRAGARAAFEKALSLNDRLMEAALGSGRAGPPGEEAGSSSRAGRAAPQEDAERQPGARPRGADVVGDRRRLEGRGVPAPRHRRRPSNLDAYGLLAGLYVAQRKLDQAVAEFDKLAARQPGAVGPPTLAAMIVQGQGKEAEARRRYERLVASNPRAAVAANNLAWIYASRGEQLDKALQLAQTAKSELPDHPEVNDTLGFVYLKKQLPSLAIPPLRIAVEKVPGNPLFHYHLGLAYSQTGDKAEARRELEQALKLKADFDGADEARALLSTPR